MYIMATFFGMCVMDTPFLCTFAIFTSCNPSWASDARRFTVPFTFGGASLGARRENLLCDYTFEQPIELSLVKNDLTSKTLFRRVTLNNNKH